MLMITFLVFFLLILFKWKLPEPTEVFRDHLCLSQPSPLWPYQAPCPISARIRFVADINQSGSVRAQDTI